MITPSLQIAIIVIHHLDIRIPADSHIPVSSIRE